MRTQRLTPGATLRSTLGLLLALVALFACALARADTPISLFQSYAGNINFVGTQRTIRTSPNSGKHGDPCAVKSSKTPLHATLSGIPSGATIISAHLYWAGSGSTSDHTVTFEGGAVTATRQYTSATDNAGYNYFGGAADVTSKVAAKGNGNYSFSGLSVDTGSPYCDAEAVLGGFSLLVVYSTPSESFRVLNLYEGFQYIHNYGSDTSHASASLSFSNFKIPTPLGTATGKIGHITWEGDSTLSGGGEDLFFNGVEMTDSYNPSGNQFNSVSNINGDTASYGVDFDAYTLGSDTMAAGQTSATTLYRSGQDLVLLNAEIIAVPNVPVADLDVTLSHSGTPGRAGSVNFTATVSNLGPNTETGPVSVSFTLPSSISYSSASGSGWSCAASGQVVTCSSSSALASGAALPQIALTGFIAASAPTSLSTVATVSGALFDNNSANNSATDTITIGAASAAGYAFTDRACTGGLSLTDPSQPCRVFSWGTRSAGDSVTGIYLTALDASQKAVSVSGSAASLQFALSCYNPATSAGMAASFSPAASVSATALATCTASGALPAAGSGWTSLAVPFNNTPSAGPYTFVYPDVGQVELAVSDGSITSRSGTFVLKPYSFQLSSSSPAASAATLDGSTGAYVKAGAAFTLSVSALNSQGVVAQNFGKETSPESVALSLAAAGGADMVNLPGIAGSFGAFSAGVASGSFTWGEVGIIELTPSLLSTKYLGTSDAVGVSDAVDVGRFYADHFDTAVTATIACPASVACAGIGLNYSRQPIAMTVTAYNSAGAVLQNYQGSFAEQVTLGALDAAGGNPLTTSAGFLWPNTVAASAFSNGVASASPAFQLPVEFSSDTPAVTVSPPRTVYLRASDSDGASSLRASGTSVEGGSWVFNGRLRVGNTFGSEVLKMPVKLWAELWSGARWVPSTADSGISSVTLALRTWSTCKDKAGASAACSAIAPSLYTSGTSLTLQNGAASFLLNPSGVVGSADLTMSAGGVRSATWLPSTTGRLRFGVYKPTPVIYVRELF